MSILNIKICTRYVIELNTFFMFVFSKCDKKTMVLLFNVQYHNTINFKNLHIVENKINA